MVTTNLALSHCHLGGLSPGGAVVDVDAHGARLDPPFHLALPLRQQARWADHQGSLRSHETLNEKKKNIVFV